MWSVPVFALFSQFSHSVVVVIVVVIEVGVRSIIDRPTHLESLQQCPCIPGVSMARRHRKDPLASASPLSQAPYARPLRRSAPGCDRWHGGTRGCQRGCSATAPWRRPTRIGSGGVLSWLLRLLRRRAGAEAAPPVPAPGALFTRPATWELLSGGPRQEALLRSRDGGSVQ
jgi:hypothetical protein